MFAGILSFIAFIVFFVTIIVQGIKSANEQKRVEKYRQEQEIKEKERQRKLQIERETAKRKQHEINEKIISSITADFATMDDWNSWDSSTHHKPGQFDRLKRAVEQNRIETVAYDSAYKVAKIKGTSGNYYITGPYGCSCWDYKTRLLPCKHMYHLAIRLEGNPKQNIVDREHGTLYGLHVVVAGRFHGGRNEIRQKINSMQGIWEDKPSENSALLICGNAPSKEKIDWFTQYHLPVLQEGDLDTIFNFASEEN